MISKIKAELNLVADTVRKEASKTMFPTSMEYMGVRTPNFRKLFKT